MRKIWLGIWLVVLMFLTLNIQGQRSTIYTNDLAEYNNALELLDKEKFSAAQEAFAGVVKKSDDLNSEVTVNSKYYHAYCGLKLFHEDSEALLIDFINSYPESPKVKKAYFHLGQYKFRKKKYKDALDWFEKIDQYDLSNEELSEYYFKVGYCHFMEEDYHRASKNLFEIKDADTKYTAPARYYYAHIAYLQEKYESSLKTFLMLEDHPKFAKIVPYYVTQIYYLQGRYDSLIAYAPALLDTASPKRAPTAKAPPRTRAANRACTR